jgi:hypothetical protein
VALTQAEWQRQEQIQVEGVSYDISIQYGGDGRFQSSWVCLDVVGRLIRRGMVPPRMKFCYWLKSASTLTISSYMA